MLKDKLSSLVRLFRAYGLISKYLPRAVSYEKGNYTILLKIISSLSRQKSLINFNGDDSCIKLSSDVQFFMRKRKALVCDDRQKVMLHAFIHPFSAAEYRKNREVFAIEVHRSSFYMPRYSCNEDGSYLVVLEEKIRGISLDECNCDIVGVFLDLWVEGLRAKMLDSQNIELEQTIYARLRGAFLSLKKAMSEDSPLFKLYTACGRPFEEQEGSWPVSFCHGQTLPVNILYDQETNKYWFIDYEPALMGCAPFAYDINFFILYSDGLISPEQKLRLKELLSSDLRGQMWHTHMLAQIVWWSRDRKLNQQRVEKINKRSLIALSLFDQKRSSE